MFTRKKYRLLAADMIALPGDRNPLGLYRIQAVRDIPEHSVRLGDLGGYVSSPTSLSHKGSCWVADKAIINSKGDSNQKFAVEGNALISDNAYIEDSSINDIEDFNWAGTLYSPRISGNSIIVESYLRGSVVVSENALLNDVYTKVEGAGIKIFGTARVYNSIFKSGIMTEHMSSIGDNARVHSTTITDKVTILGDAKVSKCKLGHFGSVIIKDKATVSGLKIAPNQGSTTTICGNATVENHGENYVSIAAHNGDVFIGDDVSIVSTNINGRAIIRENVTIFHSDLHDNNEIVGQAQVNRATLKGSNYISGTAVIPENFYAENISISFGNASYSEFDETDLRTNSNTLTKPASISGATFVPPLISQSKPANTPTSAVLSEEASSYIAIIEETISEYDDYSHDIIKLLKYPAMVDSSVSETKGLMVAIRRAKRAMKSPALIEPLRKAAEELEEAFIQAENKAHTLALSHLDSNSKKSIEEANQKFAIATNEASTVSEKKIGFKSGLRAIDGIIPVSDEAIATFKARAGLLEIEA